jgi:hypothetical protein
MASIEIREPKSAGKTNDPVKVPVVAPMYTTDFWLVPTIVIAMKLLIPLMVK